MDSGQHKGKSLNAGSQQQRGTRFLPTAEPMRSLGTLVANHNRKVSAQARGFVSAFDQHQKYMKDVMLYYGGTVPKPVEGENDFTILQRNFQFIRDEYEDSEILEDGSSKEKYESKLSLAYYHKLHKEFALANLSQFETGKIGLTWRTDQQVISGKGQFICGNIECKEKEGLKEFEVDFGYMENGIRKNELVKLTLCPVCAYKMNYKRLKDKSKKEKKLKLKEEKKNQKKRDKSHRIVSPPQAKKQKT